MTGPTPPAPDEAAVRRFVQAPLAGRVVCEPGASGMLAAEVTRLGWHRVLLIGGGGSHRATGQLLADGLGPRLAARIDRPRQHVPQPDVDAAVLLCRSGDVDGLVALGGGSAIGLAKAVAAATGAGIVAIPTTYSGSEVTPIWGRTSAGRKVTGRDQAVVPRVVLYDVELTVTMPAALTGASALNALAHCVEAAYAADAGPLTVLAAVEGSRAIGAALPLVMAEPERLAPRSELLYGAWLAGAALAGAGMGVHHALCHVLGGMFDLPHAATHAAVLPYAVAFNAAAAATELAPVAAALGVEPPGCAARLWELGRLAGAPASLAQLGLDDAAADRAARELAARQPVNPRPVTLASARELLAAALAGGRPAGP